VHDVVIDRGEVQKRKKGASKKFRAAFGHTPLSYPRRPFLDERRHRGNPCPDDLCASASLCLFVPAFLRVSSRSVSHTCGFTLAASPDESLRKSFRCLSSLDP
jgi:hypothetical protein